MRTNVLSWLAVLAYILCGASACLKPLGSSYGRPCAADADCWGELRCFDGICGGGAAQERDKARERGQNDASGQEVQEAQEPAGDDSPDATLSERAPDVSAESLRESAPDGTGLEAAGEGEEGTEGGEGADAMGQEGDVGDEGGCQPGTSRGCYEGPAGTRGKGLCRDGVQFCNANRVWDRCVGDVLPANEVCNTEDDDCDGTINEGLTRPCYTGPAGTEGEGICLAGKQSCDDTGQWGTCQGEIVPKAETCNGQDDDCDGKTDEGCQCKPNETQPCGVKLPLPCKQGIQTCTAGQWGACLGEVKPTAEVCNNVDDDCDGKIDNLDLRSCVSDTQSCQKDANGVYVCKGRCKAGLQACVAGKWDACKGEVKPNTEVCNSADDDCDGQVDEGVSRSCYTSGNGTPGVGACRAGTQTCRAGRWGPCEGQVVPTLESCNGKDDNCDGQIDESISRKCYTGPAGTKNVGSCTEGNQSCSAGQWGACQGMVLPQTETCNDEDDDCDGTWDEGCSCAATKLYKTIPYSPSVSIYNVALSGDGTLIATIDFHSTRNVYILRVWFTDPRRGLLTDSFTPAGSVTTYAVRQILFSPTFPRRIYVRISVLSSQGGDFLRVYDINPNTGNFTYIRNIAPSPNASIYKALFSTDGKILALSTGSQLLLWDNVNNAWLTPVAAPFVVREFAIHSDKLVAFLDASGKINVWDLTSRRSLWSTSVGTGARTKMVFSRYGGFLLAAHYNTTAREFRLRRWQASTGKEGFAKAFTTEHNGFAEDMVFSPGGNTFATAGRKETIIWDARTLTKVASMGYLTTSFAWLAYDGMGKKLAFLIGDRIGIYTCP